jgi:nitroreductase
MEIKNSKIINNHNHILFEAQENTEQEIISNSETYFHQLNSRRSIREFSNTPIPKEAIENIIKTASTAPSGAHKQPWTFCAISNPLVKKKIREAAEKEEEINYKNRMSERWKKDLEQFATNSDKPFLEDAPWIIVVFKIAYETSENNTKLNNYYVNESVGIASGILISAIHNAGLVTLTHTPSPMNFLSKILERPDNERPYLLLPVGLPKENTYVPELSRKSLNQISKFYE